MRIVVPNDTPWRSALFGALDTLTQASFWVQSGLLTPADTVEMLQGPVLEAMEGGDWCMIGAIWPYAAADPPPHTLICDGTIYAREDYPNLYAALDEAFIIDADSFYVPDLVNRFVFGADLAGGGSFPVAATGGEQSHTLDIGEMPAHSHTDTGHVHSESGAVATVINGGVEAPAPAATPFPTLTGSGSANLTDTGGGGAHNNMPPYLALKWAIVYE